MSAPPPAAASSESNIIETKMTKPNPRHSITTEKTFKYKVSWERDEEVFQCRGCLIPFTLTCRRHHCRACGKIYCGDCSSEQARVSGSKNIKRVCKWCKLDLVPTGFTQLEFDDEETTSTNSNSNSETKETFHSGRSSVLSSSGGRNSPLASDVVVINPLDQVDDDGEEVEKKYAEDKKPHHQRTKTMTNETLMRILAVPGNDRCVDCKTENVEWASLSHATVMCLQCSGQHRSYGVHISFVRSLKLDRWDKKQLEQMFVSGGNGSFWEFMGRSNSGDGWYHPSAKQYASTKCEWYRTKIKKLANGEDQPSPYFEDEDKKEENGVDTTSCRGDNSGHSGRGSGGSGGGGGNDDSVSYNVGEVGGPAGGNGTDNIEARICNVKKDRRPEWIADSEVKICMHCELPFGMMRRRHHCRKCGHCVCVACAPNGNTRPIPEFGYTKDVRLCLKCFCPPRYKLNK
jgi:hypothetical protein